MTDRYHTLTVVLESDIRDDDADGLMKAILHLRGVAAVSGVVRDMNSYMAEERARRELGGKLLEVIYPQKTTTP